MAGWLKRLFVGDALHRIPGDAADEFVNDPSVSREFVDGLIERDYLAFAESDLYGELRDRLVRAVERGNLLTEPDDIGNYLDRRLYHTDAEALAEGIAFAINLLAPVLRQESIAFQSLVDHTEENRVSLSIDGKKHRVYDWPNQEPPDLDTWGLAHQRLVEIVNELLDDAGSSQRLYGMHHSNDAHVIMLTEELFEYIRSAPHGLALDWMPRASDEMLDD